MIDFTLMNHQKDIITKSHVADDLFLAWEPGLGKTCATIQILRYKYAKEGKVMRTLILAPSVVLKNWKNEFGLYSKVDKNMIYVLDGPVKKRIERIKEMQNYSAIFITNYDVMQDDNLVNAFISWGVEILVCDEAHYLKSYKSKRSKSVATIADKCKHRYLLTGTPILNSAMDLFQQYRILDGYKGSESTFGTNFFAFRSRYFVDKNASWSTNKNHYPEFIPRDYTYPIMMDKIKSNTTRWTKDECLDLPDLVIQNIEVDVSSEQKRLYEEMRKDYITFITDQDNQGVPRAVVARLAITKALRMQQIVSGFCKTDDGSIIRIKDVPRLKAVRELLEQLVDGHKIIIWACFKENYSMLREVCEELGIKSVELHGDVSVKEKNEAIHKFETDPSVRVLIGNQAAGGVGVNLVAASYSIYYSRTFKLGDDIQSESRNHRRGSENHQKITRINLIANNSIDELIATALSKKQDISNSILDYTNNI